MFVNGHILPLRRPDEKTADPGTFVSGTALSRPPHRRCAGPSKTPPTPDGSGSAIV